MSAGPFDFYEDLKDKMRARSVKPCLQKPPERNPLESAYAHTMRMCDNVRHNAAIIDKTKTKERNQ